MSYQPTPEIVLCGLGDADLQIPELTVGFTRASGRIFQGNVTDAQDVADFLKSTFGKDELELQEQFIVLYLNQKCDIIGYYRTAGAASIQPLPTNALSSARRLNVLR